MSSPGRSNLIASHVYSRLRELGSMFSVMSSSNEDGDASGSADNSLSSEDAEDTSDENFEDPDDKLVDKEDGKNTDMSGGSWHSQGLTEDCSDEDVDQDLNYKCAQSSSRSSIHVKRRHKPDHAGSQNGHDSVLQHEITHVTKRYTSPSQGYPKLGRVVKGGRVHTVTMLSGREMNVSKLGHWSRADCCHMASRYLPTDPSRVVDRMKSRVYVGQFSSDGSLFVGGFQERHIRIYNVDKDWSLKKDIIARQLRWTVTDTALSHDQRFLIYATISPIVHLVNVGNESGVESLANITDIHEGLDFSTKEAGEYLLGLYSIQFSKDGSEIVAGSNQSSIHVYDLEANQSILCLQAHNDDVNAVSYADETCHIIFSGSDDNTCKVWDRRCMMSKSRPAGVLVGHLEGITFIHSRGDGRYFISNGKDQTIKLWDIRKMSTSASQSKKKGRTIPSYNWDYRWMNYPGLGKDLKHPDDQSLMTYKGHRVLRTLIRCYFSPSFTTAQKYIYTGSHDGSVYIYDLISGECVGKLNNIHKSTVRDCSWHPSEPKLVSSSWDGSIVEWEHLHGESHIAKAIPSLMSTPYNEMEMGDYMD